MMIRILRNVLILATAGLSAACLGQPDPNYYLLEPKFAPATTAPKTVGRIGLKTVSLPGYARDRQIASRDESGKVVLDDENRWAEAPDAAITRVMADTLRSGLGATVLVEPWPIGYEPERRIQIVFDKILRTTDGRVEMAGQYHILSGDGRQVLDVRGFALTEGSGENDDYEAFMRFVSEAVSRLSSEVIAALSESAGNAE